MRIANLLAPETVITQISATSKEDAISQLVSGLARVRGIDMAKALDDIAARERSGPTVLRAGSHHIAVPHASTDACKQFVIAVGTSRDGVPWTIRSQRVNLIFVLLGPPPTRALYLRVLGRIARLCGKESLLQALAGAASPQELIECLKSAEEPLGEIVAPDGMPTFCVLGAGHGGMAMAGHLAMTGCKVNLFNRTPERILPVQARGGIDVTGEVEGFASLNVVTSDPAEAVDDTDILMVVVPATAHRDMAEMIAPHIRDGQILVLNPGRTGGALEVARVLRDRNPAGIARPGRQRLSKELRRANGTAFADQLWKSTIPPVRGSFRGATPADGPCPSSKGSFACMGGEDAQDAARRSVARADSLRP